VARPTRASVLVAVVHRPRHDDWTLPKGKLDDGEDETAAALREVAEETGAIVELGPDLGSSTTSSPRTGGPCPRPSATGACATPRGVHPQRRGRRPRVDGGGGGRPARLSYPRDRQVLARFAALPPPPDGSRRAADLGREEVRCEPQSLQPSPDAFGGRGARRRPRADGARRDGRPALAHGRGSDATNMRSRIREVPDLPGLTWRIHGGDELLELVNRPTARSSSSATSSRTGVRTCGSARTGCSRTSTPRPRTSTPSARASSTSRPTSTRRLRRSGSRSPPGPRPSGTTTGCTTWAWDVPAAVTDESVETTIIERWEMPFVYEGETYVVAGDLTWVPGVSPWPWLLLGLLLVPAGAGRAPHEARDRPGRRRPGAAGPLAGAGPPGRDRPRRRRAAQRHAPDR
jgi:8-oxo-dGTP pyrophosphatase MutT (NUDIX family)